MNPNLTKRGFIPDSQLFYRPVRFSRRGALINYQAAQRYRQNSEYGYQRAFKRFIRQRIQSGGGAGKGVYANTAPQQQGIAAKLLKESSDAKIYLAELPLSYEELSNVNKFISQVGDFSYTFPERSAKGRRLPTRRWTALLPWENMPRS